MKRKRKERSDIDEFIALPNSQKQRIATELDEETPEQSLARSRPLNAREQQQWRRFKGNASRPLM
jgi:hypothetical protein